MNRLKERLQASSRFLILFGGIMIVLTVALSIWLEDFVRSTILRPLAYWIWMLDLIINTLPGRWYFTLASIIILVIAIRSFRKRASQLRFDDATKIEFAPHTGPVAIWQRRLHNLQRGRYSNVVFAENLAQILLQLLMTQHRMSQRDVIKACEDDALLIPNHIRKFLLETVHHNAYGIQRDTWLQRIWTDIMAFFTVNQEPPHDDRAIDLEPILVYMESELNLAHSQQSTRRNV